MKFWMQWTVANLVGGGLIGFLEVRGLQFTATLLLTGGVLGVLQWLVLKSHLRSVRGWAIATALGWIGGVFLTQFLGVWINPLTNLLWKQLGGWEVLWLNLIKLPLMVLMMALAQSWVLGWRRLAIAPWLLINAAGGLAKGGLSAALCPLVCNIWPLGVGAGVAEGLGWAAYGGLVGWGLMQWGQWHQAP
ncbi:MAG: hypothetical protein ACTS3T_23900 [Almyronema sp.]